MTSSLVEEKKSFPASEPENFLSIARVCSTRCTELSCDDGLSAISVFFSRRCRDSSVCFRVVVGAALAAQYVCSVVQERQQVPR